MSGFKLGIFQLNQHIKSIDMQKDALARGCDFFLFPELYKPEVFFDGMRYGYGFEERKNGDIYNSYILFGDEKKMKYRKNNLFPGYDDGRKAGKRLPHTYINGRKTYALVCYDIRFESMFDRTESPELIIIAANFPRIRINDWAGLIKERAAKYNCTVIGVNASGDMFGFDCGGMSMAVDKNGNVLNEVSDKVGLITVSI